MPVARLSLVILSLSIVGLSEEQLEKHKWFEVKSPHFLIYSDAGEGQARQVAMKLEQFRAVIEKAMPALRISSSRPTKVFAVRDEKTLKALLPSYWERKGGMRPAGVFIPGGSQSLAAMRLDTGDTSYRIIRHEYFHDLESLNFHSLPVWLTEGLAEFLANSDIRDDKARLGMPSIQLMYLRKMTPIPLRDLLLAGTNSPLYRQEDRAQIFYSQSWALTHMLMMSPGMGNGKKMNEFIQHLRDGDEEISAFEKTFGQVQDVERSLGEYVRGYTMAVAVIKDPPKTDSNLELRQLSEDEATAALADFHVPAR